MLLTRARIDRQIKPMRARGERKREKKEQRRKVEKDGGGGRPEVGAINDVSGSLVSSRDNIGRLESSSFSCDHSMGR